ncbi:MAG: multicopper oxidase family protein [Planctomycetota bacterium]|nr:multicopper oxidase family protein [Planctomycetota bacterium]
MHRFLVRCSLLCAFSPTVIVAQTIDVNLASMEAAVSLGPDHNNETAWTYNGTLPGPVIRVTEGQTLRVRYRNHLEESSMIHWHGQSVPFPMDGMGGISRPEVAPGQEMRYELSDLQPGTYFYQPMSLNHPEQVDRGLNGVLIVDPASSAGEPEFNAEAIVVLDDWLQPFGGGYRGHLMNGRTSAGQSPIVVQDGDQLRLRVINAAARTNYVFALEGHPLQVTHTDGHPVRPVMTTAIPIGIGERYDVIVDCRNPGIWSLGVSTIEDRSKVVVRGELRYQGEQGPPPSRTAVPANLETGSLLSYWDLVSPRSSSVGSVANLAMPLTLDEAVVAGETRLQMNGQSWPEVVPTPLISHETVQLDLARTASSNSAYFPLYMHGHRFRLLGTAGGDRHAPSKDSLLVYPAGHSFSAPSIQFTSGNPGRWLFRSLHVDQQQAGMMGLFDYVADSDADGIADAIDLSPSEQVPVLTIPDYGSAYSPGASGVVDLQWRLHESCSLLTSLHEDLNPQLVAPYGTLRLLAPAVFAEGTVDIHGNLRLPYALPNDPVLSGLVVYLQGLCTVNLTMSLRLGTMQAFYVR